MARATIPLAGSTIARGILSGFGRDQYFQNCYSYSVSDAITGGARIYTDKRRGWSLATVTDAITSKVGGCVWQSQSKLVFPFVKTGGTTLMVFDQAGTQIGGDIANVSGCYGICDTTISGTGNLIANLADSGTGAGEGWYYPNGGAWTQITDTDFPPNQTPAVALAPNPPCAMDGYVFWMTQSGQLWNSDLNSASAYSLNNYITADVYPDGGIGVARSGQYIVAFGTYSTQFFVNNGNPTGSPLSLVPGSAVRIGCGAGPASFMNVGNGVYFAGINTESGQRGVYCITGAEVKKISTPAIDEFLFNGGATAYCIGALKFAGYEHVMFVTSNNPGATSAWMYNVALNRWWNFTNAGNSFISCALSIGDTNTYMSAENNAGGYLLRINSSASPAVYTDQAPTGTTSLTMTIQTQPIDLGTNKLKFWKKLRLIGDKQSTAASVTVSFSDDDALNFTTAGTIDMSTEQLNLSGLGSSRRRVWKFTNASNTPLRLEAFELEYDVGTT